jgi:hypothetical protein
MDGVNPGQNTIGVPYVVPGGTEGLQVGVGVTVPQGRPHGLHCWQPVAPTTRIDATAKINNLFINGIPCHGLVRLEAHRSTEQLYTTALSKQVREEPEIEDAYSRGNDGRLALSLALRNQF